MQQPFENHANPVLMPTRLSRLKTRRKQWLQVHLWLGLLLGLFASIFGITGSILVFHAEINELLNPKLLTVSTPDAKVIFKPLAEIFQVGQTAMPSQAKPNQTKPNILSPIIHAVTPPLSN